MRIDWMTEECKVRYKLACLTSYWPLSCLVHLSSHSLTFLAGVNDACTARETARTRTSMLVQAQTALFGLAAIVRLN